MRACQRPFGKASVYPDKHALYGLRITRYNTGNISSAHIGDWKISNTYAKKVISRLEKASVYIESGEIVTTCARGHNDLAQELRELAEAILKGEEAQK